VTDALFSQKTVTWRNLTKSIATGLSIVTAVACVAWAVATQYSEITERVERQEQRLTELAALVENRNQRGEVTHARIEAGSDTRHERQQAEIEKLRAQQEATAASIAVFNVQLAAAIEMLREVRNDVRAVIARPEIPAPQTSRLDRMAPIPWGGQPLQPRGAPR
jgi:hypothetical protein